MEKKKLALIFPGMGYHKDKPLLYYSSRIVQNLGYEIIHIEYVDMPPKVFDSPALEKAGNVAYECTVKQLKEIDFSQYDDILFIGKSIGTAVMARYIDDKEIPSKQIWYTPIEQTFSFNTKDAIAFIGESDPASDLNNIRKLAQENDIVLYTYPDCNHSLECNDVDTNITNIRDVMRKTKDYITYDE